MIQPLDRAIGVLGGTFDPIHMGHLRTAIELRERLNLAKVHLIPSYQPVHRDPPIASPQERFEMVEKAIIDEPGLYADGREIERGSPSYMVTTLEALRKEMPRTPLCLLLGADAFLGLPTWHRFEKILTLAHLIVVPRPSLPLPTEGVLSQLIHSSLISEIKIIHQHLAGKIILLPIPYLDISSSNIRKLIAIGSNPRYLLPDSVYHHLQQYGTYQS